MDNWIIYNIILRVLFTAFSCFILSVDSSINFSREKTMPSHKFLKLSRLNLDENFQREKRKWFQEFDLAESAYHTRPRGPLDRRYQGLATWRPWSRLPIYYLPIPTVSSSYATCAILTRFSWLPMIFCSSFFIKLNFIIVSLENMEQPKASPG